MGIELVDPTDGCHGSHQANRWSLSRRDGGRLFGRRCCGCWVVLAEQHDEWVGPAADERRVADQDPDRRSRRPAGGESQGADGGRSASTPVPATTAVPVMAVPPGAELVEHALPGDRRDRAHRGWVERDPAAQRLRGGDHRLARLARVAGVERRPRSRSCRRARSAGRAVPWRPWRPTQVAPIRPKPNRWCLRQNALRCAPASRTDLPRTRQGRGMHSEPRSSSPSASAPAAPHRRPPGRRRRHRGRGCARHRDRPHHHPGGPWGPQRLQQPDRAGQHAVQGHGRQHHPRVPADRGAGAAAGAPAAR
jgi:hypothetical protein